MDGVEIHEAEVLGTVLEFQRVLNDCGFEGFRAFIDIKNLLFTDETTDKITDDESSFLSPRSFFSSFLISCPIFSSLVFFMASAFC